MEIAELRRRIATILAAEEMQPPDWAEVERMSDELTLNLMAEPETTCPEIIDHYLDDADIRAANDCYGAHQREKVRRFVETGEYDDGTIVSPWACAVVLALAIASIVWLVW